jgi:hypothetical protein
VALLDFLVYGLWDVRPFRYVDDFAGAFFCEEAFTGRYLVE